MKSDDDVLDGIHFFDKTILHGHTYTLLNYMQKVGEMQQNNTRLLRANLETDPNLFCKNYEKSL